MKINKNRYNKRSISFSFLSSPKRTENSSDMSA